MTTFRKKYTIKTADTGGFFVDGEWVEGDSSEEFEILATVQPATQNDYIELSQRVDGGVVSGVVRIYTDKSLKPAGNDLEDNTARGDVLIFNNSEYEIYAKASWQSGIISHYKYLAVKL
ncbi:hypothetical protein [Phocoenobacter skyensis]|uniref:Uncharacterized protein n=1 Tax=Phocoenobacter skyensis TaxID=97481 RepID=A0ABT9JID6_9PAST|nr:hypothetical protein [Pasteurella skyensis]MDP8078338.1 hypothetical protein [Pasteurella skyensis]MDP8084570.1 hypothetical protein [Pasteurella skyensis]